MCRRCVYANRKSNGSNRPVEPKPGRPAGRRLGSPETIKNEKVFLPSCVELGRNASSVYGSKLPIFTDNASRKRATRSGEYNSSLTMLRLSTGFYDGDYIGVDENGNFDGGSESTVFYPLICFCV